MLADLRLLLWLKRRVGTTGLGDAFVSSEQAMLQFDMQATCDKFL